MKKSILLILSFLLFLHSGIINSFFEIQQEFLKKEIQENLEIKLSFILKIPTLKFQNQSISNNEITYKNELHDIISMEKKNDFVYLRVINDKIEKDFIEKTTDYKNKTHSKNKASLLKFKINSTPINGIEFTLTVSRIKFQKELNCSYNCLYLNPNKNRNYPPPKIYSIPV